MDSSVKLISERINPLDLDSNDNQLSLHQARYRVASTFCRPGKILDAGCGTGYGTKILSEKRSNDMVIGIDNSKEALEIAAKYYNSPKIYYQLSDIQNFYSPYKFANLICLEVLEHLDHPYKFLMNATKYLGVNAVVVVSVPITEKTGDNHFHKHCFDENSITDLFSRVFKIQSTMKQEDNILIVGSYARANI